jgi:hypothetical protein
MRWFVVLPFLLLSTFSASAQPRPPAILEKAEAIELDRVIPANERGIVCLAEGKNGLIFGGTAGRAAHFFAYDPKTGNARSLARLGGGVGFSHALILLPDGSLVAGTQADPTGTAVRTDPKAVGRLLRFFPGASAAKVQELGVPVAGQGIYTLAYDESTHTIVGNTWPDGHFFSFNLKNSQATDHGAIAGFRTFETPKAAEDLNKGTKDNVHYPRQVSRAIVMIPKVGAVTAGADGVLYRYDLDAQRLEKLKVRLPAVPGREPWTSLDVAVLSPGTGGEWNVIGGTSDGYLFELRPGESEILTLRPRGRVLSHGGIQGLALAMRSPGFADGEKGKKAITVYGVGGHAEGMPRTFTFSHGGGSSAVLPGGIMQVDNALNMIGIGALMTARDGRLYGGEKDRLARLLRFGEKPPPKKAVVPPKAKPLGVEAGENLPKLDCWVIFAPEGTTTDGSGYTAISVGLDGRVYVGSARYGGYAWLLRFDPNTRSFFMERVVDMQQLSGERLRGINTQGKIHAIIIVGPDGRIWFATKQAHEIFGTRPEYDDYEGFPGGHLCYFDPKTGFSRSVGILKKQEGLMAGAIDAQRQKLYYRSEPKNIFLSYDIPTGAVKEHGHVGANCRYMAIDKQGAVYQPGRGDYLSRFDPETGYLEELAVKLEGAGHYAAPYVIQMGPNGKLYGAGINHPWILEFDVASYKKGPFPEVTVRNVAPAAPPGVPVQDIHAGTFGKDGKFYYPLLTTTPLEKGGKALQHLRIMRFDPATKRVETVGIPDVSKLDETKVKHTYVRGSQERYRVDHIQGMAVGPDGSLYMMDIYPQLNVVCFPKLTAPK